MWDEFLRLLQIWDDDEDENWIWIDSVEWAGDDLALSTTLAYQDETRHRWEIRCRAVLAYSIVDVRGGGLELIDDPAHPLVRVYADEHATLYFNGESTDWFSVFGRLLAAHHVVCGDWAPSTAYLRGGVDLLRGEHGLLAEGPVFVLAAYAEVLDGCAIKHSIVGRRPYRLWNGERFLEPGAPQAIHFGDSWVVANAFEAKDLGAVPAEPTTGVPERYCERHIARSTRARVAEAAGIGDASGMQDWPLEVADPDRTPEFLDLLELEAGADERYAFMELVLYSLDQASDSARTELWPRVAAALNQSPRDFAYLIIYWSCVEEHPDGSWRPAIDQEEQFHITPLMRDVLRGIAGELDFNELVQSD